MRVLIVLFIIIFALPTKAQLDISDTTLSVPMFYASYSYQVPGGDLANRYGKNSVVSGGFQWKTNQNWVWGLDFSFIFGNDVKNGDQIMYNLKTQYGNIIDQTGNFASYFLYERGFCILGKIGKLIPVLSPNPNSGFLIMGGIGYLQHKTRIEVQNNTAPQLVGDYKRGYDRLAGGMAINQFIGYLFLSDSRLLNFYGGFEFTQAWTKPRRDVNFDTRKPDEVLSRFDVFSGFRIGWIVPLFKRMPERHYYN